MMLLNIASTIIFWVKEYKSLYSQATLLSKTKEKKPIQKMNKKLKEVANLETLSNEQDGVALVLERLYQEINKG